MNFTNAIRVVDSHTVGQATRIIVGGTPALKGNTMMEKKEYLRDNFDYIRRATMLEPRGHADMFGAILCEPCSKEADYGMIFLDGAEYLNMCGHGTIGVATVLVEMNMVKVSEPYTYLTLEAPAGLVKVKVHVENGRALDVTFTNVPAFVYEKDLVVNVPDVGDVKMDICFGGSFFAIIEAASLGLEISTQNVEKNVPVALKILDYLKENHPVAHPLLPEINKVELIELYGPAKSADADVQNMVVLGKGEVDRSPCGTGTCAKLADLHAKGELGLHEKFVHESVLQTKFTGEILEETKVADYDAIVPQITGQAFITGFNNLIIDNDDPLKHGFILKDA